MTMPRKMRPLTGSTNPMLLPMLWPNPERPPGRVRPGQRPGRCSTIDADQAAGTPLPASTQPILYKAWTATPTASNDVTRPASFHSAAVIRVDYVNAVNASGGFLVSMRALDYQGPETYCDATGHCMAGPVTLTTRPGFDSMTGLGSPSANFVATLAKF